MKLKIEMLKALIRMHTNGIVSQVAHSSSSRTLILSGSDNGTPFSLHIEDNMYDRLIQADTILDVDKIYDSVARQ